MRVDESKMVLAEAQRAVQSAAAAEFLVPERRRANVVGLGVG